MDQNQEAEAARLEAEVAAAAALGSFAGTDTSEDGNKEDSPLSGNQATDAGNPNYITTPAGDVANQAEPQQAEEMAPPASAPAKRGRGRPRKHPLTDVAAGSTKVATPASKLDDLMSIETPPSKRRRGRPPKGKGNHSPSTANTPARVRSDLETEPDFGTPLTNKGEWLDKMEQASSFSPINLRQRPSIIKTSNYQSANDAFGIDLKSKLREAMFDDGLEYNGGVHVPGELAQSLHDYLGAGLPAPRGELFIRAELVEELRHLLR